MLICFQTQWMGFTDELKKDHSMRISGFSTSTMDHFVNHISGLSCHLHVRGVIKRIPSHWHVPPLNSPHCQLCWWCHQKGTQWSLHSSSLIHWAGVTQTRSFGLEKVQVTKEVKEKSYSTFLTKWGILMKPNNKKVSCFIYQSSIMKAAVGWMNGGAGTVDHSNEQL